jgi:hypothetical protein
LVPRNPSSSPPPRRPTGSPHPPLNVLARAAWAVLASTRTSLHLVRSPQHATVALTTTVLPSSFSPMPALCPSEAVQARPTSRIRAVCFALLFFVIRHSLILSPSPPSPRSPPSPATNSPPSTTNLPPRPGNHAHPAKLLKKPQHPSPPPLPLPNVPSSVPPALTHSDTTSSDDYDSDETYPRPLFPLTQPDTVFSPPTERDCDHDRARKTSGSSDLTILPAPTPRYSHARTGLGLSIGRRAWNSTNESSEDDCLSGF